jgi:enterochelin esterase-like enzyme
LAIQGLKNQDYLQYRGPEAPPKPGMVDALKGRVEDLEIDSPNLKSKRKLVIYVPSAPPPKAGYPVVYMADGLSVYFYAHLVEKLIDDGKIRPVLLVGMANGGALRGAEYLPDPKAMPPEYLSHEAFVFNEVMPLAEKAYYASLRPQDRMSFGFSNGATWALSAALRHPGMIRHVAAFSIGMPKAYFDFSNTGKLDLYLEAGRFEPSFFERTQAVCDKARQSRVKCGFMALYAGHDQAAWDIAFADTLTSVFGR